MEFPKLPPHDRPVLSTVDMHTGEEQLGIFLSRYSEVKGVTILTKRHYVREHLRRVLTFEPCGHYDMYGALLVRSELPEADLEVLFMHNEGYSTMCSHVVIALGRFAVDYGLIKASTSPETHINIHCPCGLVKTFAQYSDGKTGLLRFRSVPAFAFATGHGSIVVDISYGESLYAFMSAYKFGLDVSKSQTRDLVDAATAVTNAMKFQVTLHHPVSEDMAFLYGTILTDGKDAFSGEPTANVCLLTHRRPCVGSSV